MQAKVFHAEKDRARLQESESQLLHDRERASEEIAGMRLYVQQVDKEKRKSDLVHKFVKKHGPAVDWDERERSYTPATEALSRLSADMRKSRPQFLPTVTKLQREFEVG